MKTFTIICMLGFLFIGLTSCKKNYACSCEITETQYDPFDSSKVVGSSTTKQMSSYEKLNKKDADLAKTNCEKNNGTTWLFVGWIKNDVNCKQVVD
jgi:hypothetical protein